MDIRTKIQIISNLTTELYCNLGDPDDIKLDRRADLLDDLGMSDEAKIDRLIAGYIRSFKRTDPYTRLNKLLDLRACALKFPEMAKSCGIAGFLPRPLDID